ncbi:hypothetical protein BGW80DRAFT_1305313, partial [Lactifluus volemus]
MPLHHLSDMYGHSYTVVTIAILIYDHILTFSAEVSHIWPQPLSIHTVLFFLNRYVGLVTNTGASALVFFSTNTTVEVFVVLSQFIVAGILLSRIFALYYISRIIRIGAFSLGVVLAAVISWALAGQKRNLIHGVPGCLISIPQRT